MTCAEHASYIQTAIRREQVAYPLYALMILTALSQASGEPASLVDLAERHGTTYLGIRHHIRRNSDLFHILEEKPFRLTLSRAGITLLGRIHGHIARLSCPQA